MIYNTFSQSLLNLKNQNAMSSIDHGCGHRREVQVINQARNDSATINNQNPES